MGIEADAVFSLLQRAGEEHELRSAFTPESIRGWVYLECSMNTALVRLLSWTPGIIRTRRGVSRQPIDFLDWTKVLTIEQPQNIVKAGGWVRARRGMYKGDVGLVVGFGDGVAEVLLVPRLKGPTMDSSSKRRPPTNSSKRRRSTTRPTPELFDPAAFKRLHNRDPKRQEDGGYTAGGFTFEHGLIRKRYDLHSILSDVVDISSRFLNLFLLSNHPTILTSAFPRPQEWSFEEREWVTIQPSNKLGSVNFVFLEYLEVELASNEGAVPVPWRNVRKFITVGDFVSITAGPLCGKTGWVHRINKDIVHVLEKCIEGEVSGPDAGKAIKVSTSRILQHSLILFTGIRSPYQLDKGHQYPVPPRTTDPVPVPSH